MSDRRTGATHLTGEGLSVSRFVVSQVLNHISDTGGSSAVTAIYDRNAYLSQKRHALEAWALRGRMGERVKVTEGIFTFVSLDNDGEPCPLTASR